MLKNIKDMKNFKLKSGNCGSFKMMGSSPAKGLKDQSTQVIDGQLCDAYGNPAPTSEEMKGMTQSPNFKNNSGKVNQGLTPKEEKKEIIENESNEKSGIKTEKPEEPKVDKKKQDMDVMNSSIDMAMGIGK